jgi:hypothetical protein
MRFSWRLSACVAGFFAAASWIAGCSVAPIHSTSNPLQPSTPSTATVSGLVHGGQWPVKGGQVYMLAASQVTPGAGDAGYGDPSTSLISSSPNNPGVNGWNYVLTDANGKFNIPSNTYSCSPGQQVYLYAVNGDSIDEPGTISSQNMNSAIGLMALLGECGASNSLPTVHAAVEINEVTTVAAAYALAGFAADATDISSPATGQGYLGIQNAVKNAALLADIGTGDIPQSLPATVTVPSAMIYTLADILADCVNTQNSSTTQCTRLMGDETFNSRRPSDTAWAAINMAHQPGANVADLYNNMLADQVFGGFINTGPPNDFAIGIGYSDSGLTAPTAVAVDASGNAWVTDTPGGGSSGAVIMLGPQGSALNGPGGYTCGDTLTQPSSITLGPSSSTPETGWVASIPQETMNGVPMGSDGTDCIFITPPDFLTCPGWCDLAGVAAGNDLYFVDNGRTTLYSYDFTGDAGSYWQGFTNPQGLAIDGTGNFWIPDAGYPGSVNPALYVVASGTLDVANDNAPFGSSGNAAAAGLNRSLWVTDVGNNSVYLFSTDFTGATPTATLATTIPNTRGGINNPGPIVMDGAGTAWIVDAAGANIAAISSGGTPLSPDAVASVSNGGYSGNQALANGGTPTGIAVDPSGDVWVTQQNAGSPLVEFIGIAAPTITPLADAVVNNTIATKP